MRKKCFKSNLGKHIIENIISIPFCFESLLQWLNIEKIAFLKQISQKQSQRFQSF